MVGLHTFFYLEQCTHLCDTQAVVPAGGNVRLCPTEYTNVNVALFRANAHSNHYITILWVVMRW